MMIIIIIVIIIYIQGSHSLENSLNFEGSPLKVLEFYLSCEGLYIALFSVSSLAVMLRSMNM